MIYLDHHATTPVAPEVLEAMMPYLTTEWGNPSSSYRFGSKLKGVVEVAREQVAELIGAHAGEVIFTSCATESNNAAIHAVLKATGKRHVVTSAVEHSSVLNYVPSLVGTAPPGRPRFGSDIGAPGGRALPRHLPSR
jgi:cysteine desulfurase